MRVFGGLFALFIFSCALFAADNPRVFITDSHSWEISSGGGGTADGFGAGGRGGARPQTAEIIKTFHERCPNLIINNRREKADYVVVLDHEGGKASIRRDNKIAIFEQASGDAIFSRSTRSLGNAVKDACGALFRDWSNRAAMKARETAPEGAQSTVGASANVRGASVRIDSAPSGAEIEIDGAFVGSTPSSIHLTPGTHTVVVMKKGFESWQREIVISAGDVNLTAELVKQ